MVLVVLASTFRITLSLLFGAKVMATLTATITELDVIDVWELLDKYNVDLSINEIVQQRNVLLSNSKRIIVRNGKLMLEVL